MHRPKGSASPANQILIDPPMGQEHPFLCQIRGDLPRRPQLSELGENQGNGLADGFVGYLDDAALAVVLIPNWQVRAQRSAACGFPQPTVQPRTNQVELEFRHGAFEPEQEPVIENTRMVETISI